MHRSGIVLAVVWCVGAAADPALAQTKMSLPGMIHALAGDIRTKLNEDPRVMGQRLSLGEFAGEGPEAENSNFGLDLKRQFQDLLKDVLVKRSEYTLTGSYHFVSGEQPDNRKLQVIRIVVLIKRVGKEVLSFDREVNNSDDITKVLGLTGATAQEHRRPPNLQERNDSVKDMVAKPTFDVVDETRVAGKGHPEWSVGILKKKTFNGAVAAVKPENDEGHAFVDIGIGEYYEIELVNRDKSDAVATINVDGLDVANTFSEDKDASGELIHWPGYLVPAGHRVVIRGWLHTVKPQAKDGVFAFLVAELGHGAASALKARGSVGVVTIQFREAGPPDRPLTKRSFGETAKGEGLEEKLTVKPMTIGDNVLSTVSIRYHRPQ